MLKVDFPYYVTYFIFVLFYRKVSNIEQCFHLCRPISYDENIIKGIQEVKEEACKHDQGMKMQHHKLACFEVWLKITLKDNTIRIKRLSTIVSC